jgi:hypothetical protein
MVSSYLALQMLLRVPAAKEIIEHAQLRCFVIATPAWQGMWQGISTPNLTKTTERAEGRVE